MVLAIISIVILYLSFSIMTGAFSRLFAISVMKFTQKDTINEFMWASALFWWLFWIVLAGSWIMIRISDFLLSIDKENQ